MYELTLNKRLNLPVTRAFSAWREPGVMQKWFAPGDMTVPEADIDFRVGGSYRIVMQASDGQRHIVGGTYHEILDNERLRFSWQWEGSELTTEVELQFRGSGDQTEMTLIHREFPDTDTRDKHNQGWEGCLAKLAQL